MESSSAHSYATGIQGIFPTNTPSVVQASPRFCAEKFSLKLFDFEEGIKRAILLVRYSSFLITNQPLFSSSFFSSTAGQFFLFSFFLNFKPLFLNLQDAIHQQPLHFCFFGRSFDCWLHFGLLSSSRTKGCSSRSSFIWYLFWWIRNGSSCS